MKDSFSAPIQEEVPYVGRICIVQTDLSMTLIKEEVLFHRKLFNITTHDNQIYSELKILNSFTLHAPKF